MALKLGSVPLAGWPHLWYAFLGQNTGFGRDCRKMSAAASPAQLSHRSSIPRQKLKIRVPVPLSQYHNPASFASAVQCCSLKGSCVRHAHCFVIQCFFARLRALPQIWQHLDVFVRPSRLLGTEFPRGPYFFNLRVSHFQFNSRHQTFSRSTEQARFLVPRKNPIFHPQALTCLAGGSKRFFPSLSSNALPPPPSAMQRAYLNHPLRRHIRSR